MRWLLLWLLLLHCELFQVRLMVELLVYMILENIILFYKVLVELICSSRVDITWLFVDTVVRVIVVAVIIIVIVVWIGVRREMCIDFRFVWCDWEITTHWIRMECVSIRTFTEVREWNSGVPILLLLLLLLLLLHLLLVREIDWWDWTWSYSSFEV